MERLNKRGQFYLIAAIVIVSLAAGFVVITNTLSKPPSSNVGYLKGELNIESSQIINYGISNGLSNQQIEGLLINMSKDYINNTQNGNFYFILGNSTNATLVSYQSNYYNVSINGTVVDIGTGATYMQSFESIGNSIVIKINDTSYVFELNSGENFHFVIKSLINGGDYTSEG